MFLFFLLLSSFLFLWSSSSIIMVFFLLLSSFSLFLCTHSFFFLSFCYDPPPPPLSLSLSLSIYIYIYIYIYIPPPLFYIKATFSLIPIYVALLGISFAISPFPPSFPIFPPPLSLSLSTYYVFSNFFIISPTQRLLSILVLLFSSFPT